MRDFDSFVDTEIPFLRALVEAEALETIGALETEALETARVLEVVFLEIAAALFFFLAALVARSSFCGSKFLGITEVLSKINVIYPRSTI